MENENVLLLDPKAVVVEDNIRFGLKQLRIDELAASIAEQGRILQPVGVMPVEGVKGKTHRLLFGFYRFAALEKLNKDGAGMKLPAIELSAEDAVTHKKMQVAENAQREDLSPMDKAVAMKQLLDAGVARGEIRRIFSTATGKKNLEVRPISNASLNIYLRFLDLPKTIQERIHDGRLGVNAAYELGRVPPDKRQAVIERAEKERLAQIEMEEKDEERYLNAERKATEADTKVAETLTAEEEARKAIEEAEAIHKAKKDALMAVQKEPYLELDEAGKKAVMERIKAAQTDLKAAEKLTKDAKNDLAKALKAKGNASELAAKKKAELEAARKAKPKTKVKGEVDRTAVKKAAQKEGAAGNVPLNLGEIRQALKDLLADGVPAHVQRIAKVFKNVCDGMTTPKESIADFEAIFRPAPVAAAAPATAAAPVKPAAAPAKK